MLDVRGQFRRVKRWPKSNVDRLGYVVAKMSVAGFLTGDKKFENMSHVEFVK